MKKAKHIQREFYEKKYVEIVTSMAQLTYLLETLTEVPNEKVVSQDEEKRGTMLVKRDVNAKEAGEDASRKLNDLIPFKRALERLLNI